MPRPARVHVRNGVFHVTQRATDHETLFVDAIDHNEFDRLLALAVKRCRWTLHAHCHMTNHVHLLIQTPEPLARGMQFLTGQYVQEFNLRHGRRGALVQGRYKAALVETEEHYLSCLHYFAHEPGHRRPLRPSRRLAVELVQRPPAGTELTGRFRT